MDSSGTASNSGVENVSIEYQLTADDFAAWARLSQRMSVRFAYPWILWIIGIAFGLAITASFLMHPLVANRGYIVGAFFVLCVVMIRYAPVARYMARRQFRRLTSLHGAAQASFSFDAITVAGPYGSGVINWTAYERYLLDDQVLALVMQTKAAHLFPRRAFDREGWVLVEGWVRAKLLPGDPTSAAVRSKDSVGQSE